MVPPPLQVRSRLVKKQVRAGVIFCKPWVTFSKLTHLLSVQKCQLKRLIDLATDYRSIPFLLSGPQCPNFVEGILCKLLMFS